MGLFRMLFWILVIASAVWIWHRLRLMRQAKRNAQAEVKPMVRCVHCRLHLPEDQALQLGGDWYCSQDHWVQHQKAPKNH